MPNGAHNGYYLVYAGCYVLAYLTTYFLLSLDMIIHLVHPQYIDAERYGFTISHYYPTEGWYVYTYLFNPIGCFNYKSSLLWR